MEQSISRFSSKEIMAFVAAGAFIVSGYFLSKNIIHPPIASAASCDLNQDDTIAAGGEELHVVGCSGIL